MRSRFEINVHESLEIDWAGCCRLVLEPARVHHQWASGSLALDSIQDALPQLGGATLCDCHRVDKDIGQRKLTPKTTVSTGKGTKPNAGCPNGPPLDLEKPSPNCTSGSRPRVAESEPRFSLHGLGQSR